VILYHLVGLGFSAYARLRLDVAVTGELRPERGTLYVATHRSHLDIPVFVGSLYARARRRPDALPWFVTRDDLFLPGFPAHLAPGRLPLAFGIGPVLERQVRCVRVRPATRMRLVDLCRAQPELPLDALPYAAELRARAAALGRHAPRRAGDALRSRYADLLWRLVDRAEAPAAETAWAERRARARADLQRLVDLLRAGESVFMCPEGTPSRNGRVGPVQRGVGLLVRRGRPQRIVPIGVDYERAGGRVHALVRVGEPVAPPREDVESRVRTLLRETVREVGHAA
jgi:1-acyl-sn-glycerol-3-phosphate acyltransferase